MAWVPWKNHVDIFHHLMVELFHISLKLHFPIWIFSPHSYLINDVTRLNQTFGLVASAWSLRCCMKYFVDLNHFWITYSTESLGTHVGLLKHSFYSLHLNEEIFFILWGYTRASLRNFKKMKTMNKLFK